MHVHILSGSRTGPARWEQVSLPRKLCGIDRGQLCPSASPAANAVTGSNAVCRGQVPPKRFLAVDEPRESGGSVCCHFVRSSDSASGGLHSQQIAKFCAPNELIRSREKKGN